MNGFAWETKPDNLESHKVIKQKKVAYSVKLPFLVNSVTADITDGFWPIEKMIP